MSKKAEELADKGIAYLENGDVTKAKEMFEEAVKIDSSVPMINNLALAKFMSGDWAGAMDTLSVNLGNEEICSPYAHGLAARILSVMGQKEEALKHVKEAVKHFESGVSLQKDLGHVSDSWKEYSTIIMRAAAESGEHRMVLDLYKKWHNYHVSWENAYLAGIAAFNLKKFKQAASYWTNIYEINFAAELQQVAILAERGTIPPFNMEYEVISHELGKEIINEKSKSDEEFKECINRGIIRMVLLITALREDAGEDLAGQITESLILYGDDWGRQLGEGFLMSTIVPFTIKYAAAKALVESGVYNFNEPIQMYFDGKTQEVAISRFEIIWELDEETETLYNLAISSRNKGAVDEAVKLFETIFEDRDIFYPPAMMTLANLYRQKDLYDKAQRIYQMLEEISPEEPAVLFNFSAYWMECGDFDKAREYLERINIEGLDEFFLEKIEALKNEIDYRDQDLVSWIEEKMYAAAEESMREKIENKRLSINSSLLRCLKNMPVEWLEGICRRCGFKPDRLRKDKEAQIIKFYSDIKNVQTVVEGLDSDEMELINYLLENEGWARINVVTRKFGSIKGDGYYWDEEEPESTQGKLWSKGLVAVGTTYLDNRRCRIVLIPLELRDMLKRIAVSSFGRGAGRR